MFCQQCSLMVSIAVGVIYIRQARVLKARFSFFVCVYFCFSLSLQLFLQLFFLKLSLMSHDSMISIAMGVIYIRQARRLLRQDSHSLFMFIFVFLYLYNYLLNFFFLQLFNVPRLNGVNCSGGNPYQTGTEVLNLLTMELFFE